MDIWMYKCTDWQTNIWTNADIQTSEPTLHISSQYAKRAPLSIPRGKKFSLFKDNFLHLRVLEYYYYRTFGLHWA